MESKPAVTALPLQQRLARWVTSLPDEAVLRAIFRATLAVALAVLALDLAGMNGLTGPAPGSLPDQTPAAPGLSVPAILAPLLPGSDQRGVPMPRPDAALAKPMSFELVGGGKLMATGTITPGVSEAFAAEIAKRGDYVKTVVLNSPGGSVSDAIAMGRLIRDKQLSTEVEAGRLCASSCPLMYFGGVERKAGSKAAIGVHQVFAPPQQAQAQARDDMSDAQRISARCQRYLADMGIDLQVWVHAMETPKERLFVFKPDELSKLKIVTAAPSEQAAGAVKSRT